ncbi:MAG: PAS domain S-box protein [Calditrichaeota bacterium]|nr:MAG: PAS domain S-box protein [Calditrichota bacterium]
MSRRRNQDDKNTVDIKQGTIVTAIGDSGQRKTIEHICRSQSYTTVFIDQTESSQVLIQCEIDCDLLILEYSEAFAKPILDLALKVVDRYHIPVILLTENDIQFDFQYEFHEVMVQFVLRAEAETSLYSILKYMLPQAKLMLKQSRSVLLNKVAQFNDRAMLLLRPDGKIISGEIKDDTLFGDPLENLLGYLWTDIVTIEDSEISQKITEQIANSSPKDCSLHFENILVQTKTDTPEKLLLNIRCLRDKEQSVHFALIFSSVHASQIYHNLNSDHTGSQLLLNFVEKLNRTNTFDEVYEDTALCVKDLFTTDICAVDRYDQPRSLSFITGLTENYKNQSLPFCPWDVSDTDAYPVSYLNVESSDLPQFEKMLLAEDGVRSCVYFPLVGEKRIIGALIVYFTKIHALSQEEIKLGRALTHNLSTTIRRIYSHTQFQKSELKYQSIFDHVVEGIYQSTKSGKFITVNNALIKMLGYGSEKEVMALNLPVDIYLDPEVRHQLASEVDEQGFLHDRQLQLKKKDGSVITVIMNDRAVRDQNGQFLYYEGTLVDVTEKIEVQAELERNEKQLKAVINSSPDLIILKDAEGKWLVANSAAESRFGLESVDFVGKNDDELTRLIPQNKDFFEVSKKFDEITWRRHDLIRYEAVLHKSDDPMYFDVVKVPSFADDGSRWALVTIARDVTKIKKDQRKQLQLEKKIQKAQKHESLYILAGGIAHDFNNLLVSILGNAGLALMELNHESPVAESIKQIEIASQRAADLTKQLLAYSGKGKFVLEIVNLSKLVEEMAHLLEISISKDITLIYDFKKEMPPIEADPTQIRQIVMNLITNASEAIGKKWGRIHVTTGMHSFAGEDISQYFIAEEPENKDYCYIEVRDTGCGMSSATLKKIFDPFYTTKFTGRGLGLAAVLGIVRGHKGTIKVESDVINGTTFRAIFPCSKKVVLNRKEVSLTYNNLYTNTTILVVDDEETVLNVTCRILKQYGFRVISAQDGYEAVEQIKSQNDKISLVILDMTMPGLDGEATFREMRKYDPNLKVILSSGFSEQEATNKFAGKGLTGFIQKPYRPIELALKVQSALPDVANAPIIEPSDKRLPAPIPKFHTGDSSKLFTKS